MMKSRILIAVLPLLAAAPAAAQEDVRYLNGDVELAAELMLPASGAPTTGVVVVQGSGNSDRTNQWARLIANEFVNNGAAVLLTDKRGNGKSGGDWRTVGFEEYADDALAGVRFLKQRFGQSMRVGVAGLSQGGWIAPLAAARSSDVAFVIDLSGAAVRFDEQAQLEMENTARSLGLPDSAVAEVLALNVAAGEFLRSGAWAPYDQLRTAGLARSWRRIAEGYPATPDDARWSWLRRVAFFDPDPYWRKLSVPALVVYGAADEKDNVPVEESVRRLERAFSASHNERAKVVVVPGAGHALLETQQALHRAVVKAIADFMASIQR